MRHDLEDVLLGVVNLDVVAEYLGVVVLHLGLVRPSQKVRALEVAHPRKVQPGHVQRLVARVEGVGPVVVQGVPALARFTRKPSGKPTLSGRRGCKRGNFFHSITGIKEARSSSR